MFSWILNNISTILIALVIFIILGLIIINEVKKRKKSNIKCSSCQGCALSDTCHKK